MKLTDGRMDDGQKAIAKAHLVNKGEMKNAIYKIPNKTIPLRCDLYFVVVSLSFGTQFDLSETTCLFSLWNIAKYSVCEASYFVSGATRLISASFGSPNHNKGNIMIIKNVVNVYILRLAIDTKMSFGVGKLQFNHAQVWGGPFKSY